MFTLFSRFVDFIASSHGTTDLPIVIADIFIQIRKTANKQDPRTRVLYWSANDNTQEQVRKLCVELSQLLIQGSGA